MGGWETIINEADLIKRKIASLIDDSNRKSIERSLQSASILTSSFYLSTKLFQRIAGSLSIHSGRPLIASGFGFLSIAASSLLSIQINESAISMIETNGKLSFDYSQDNIMMKILDDRFFLSMSAFSLLERKSFLTAVPSSVISVGVHAKHANFLRMFHGSVISTDITATAKEREKIQKLGKKYGCHHCGSKQIFHGKNTFIADHMPPTKVALLKNEKWWRKLLNFKVIQRLWPQCQSCFSLQGTAVKLNNHLLIYHYKFRQHHLAPAIVFFLTQNKSFQEFLEYCKPENLIEKIKPYL